MMELAFRYSHACPFNDLSRRHPTIPMAHWCNEHREVLEASHPVASELAALRDDITQMARGRVHQFDSAAPHRSLRVTMDCVCLPKPSVENRIERFGGLPLRPILYHEGWEHYRVLVPQDANVARILAELGRTGQVEVTLKRRSTSPMWHSNFLLPASDICGRLTAKQVNTLRAALRAGYYRDPRAVKAADIAARLRSPRSTFEEHLRKAENKVLRALSPYLELWQDPDPPGRGRVAKPNTSTSRSRRRA